jgi:molecular chaperone GrpE (heat shock protein)
MVEEKTEVEENLVESDNSEVPEEQPEAEKPEEASHPESGEEEATEPEDKPDPLKEVIYAIQTFDERLDKHLRQTSSFSKDAFDNLYEEMRQYKDNFLLSAQRPLLNEIMMLYDSVNKLKKIYETSETIDIKSLLGNLEGLTVEAEEILARREILPIYESSEKLNKDNQKAIKTVPTDNPDEDMLIIEHNKTGFTLGESIFRREEVTVKKYKPQENSEKYDTKAEEN